MSLLNDESRHYASAHIPSAIGSVQIERSPIVDTASLPTVASNTRQPFEWKSWQTLLVGIVVGILLCFGATQIVAQKRSSDAAETARKYAAEHSAEAFLKQEICKMMDVDPCDEDLIAWENETHTSYSFSGIAGDKGVWVLPQGLKAENFDGMHKPGDLLSLGQRTWVWKIQESPAPSRKPATPASTP